MTGQIKDGFLIQARAPRDGAIIDLALDQDFLEEIKIKLRLGHTLGCALGFFLVDNILTKPRAVFRGLKRDLHCASDPVWYSADRAMVYICDLSHAYEPQGSGLARVSAPRDSVFAVTVRYWEASHGQPTYRDLTSGRAFTPSGVVEYWEWLVADPSDATLPEEYHERYTERVDDFS